MTRDFQVRALPEVSGNSQGASDANSALVRGSGIVSSKVSL
jgi:hypothetical protein